MKHNLKRWGALCLALCLMLSLGTALADKPSQEEINSILNAATDKSQIESPLLAAIQKGRQSVVGINVYNGEPGNGRSFTPDDQPLGIGSGTVISPWGHVLTNAHVVEGASFFAVQRDYKLYNAYLIDHDKKLDIAILFVPGLKLPPVTIGNSDALQVGEWAITIGNPMDHSLERSVMIGVVSAVRREVEGEPQEDKYGLNHYHSMEMVQTDAAINPGMSGGGMFNALGQLMGIPTLKMTEQSWGPAPSDDGEQATRVDSIGMCIPIKPALPMIRKVLEAYDGSNQPPKAAEEEAPKGPRMGVMLYELDDSFPPRKYKSVPRGVLVEDVEPGSPAAKAGIKAGDIIVEMAGELVGGFADLGKVHAAQQAGSKVAIKVFRARGTLDVLHNKSQNYYLEGSYLDLEIQFD